MIEVNKLAFTYAGGRQALKGISFAVRAGELFGFLGPSGAGKSTTQKILIGLLKGYSGTVVVLGRELATWGADYYERIGVSFELPNHYQKLTARENLAFFRSLYSGPTDDPHDLLALVGLADDADTRVAQYSKGMQMRLNVARALLNRPDLLFLDEPTAGLDPRNARRIKDLLLRRKAEGRTIFLTTHDMTLADELCDRVAFIVDGVIPLIDSPRVLKVLHGQRRVRVEFRADGRLGQREFALDDLANDRDFLALLRSGRVETIHTQEATLEDVFIRVTGKSLV